MSPDERAVRGAPSRSQIVSVIAVGLMRAEIDQLDAAIDQALASLGVTMSIERAFVALIFEDGQGRVGYRWPERPAGEAAHVSAAEIASATARLTEARGSILERLQPPSGRIMAPMFAGERVAGWLEIDGPFDELAPEEHAMELVAQLIHYALERKRLAAADRRRAERARAQQDALVELAKRPEVFRGDLPIALMALTEVASWAVGTRSASVWLVSDDGTLLRRADSFDVRSGVHRGESIVIPWDSLLAVLPELERGPAVLALANLGAWRDGKEVARMLACPDLGGLLVAVARSRGKVAALVTYEHADEPRAFSADDRSFAVSLAGLLTTAIEAADHRSAAVRQRLQEERYRRLVELSPDAIFLTSEDRIVFVNDAAVRLLRAPSMLALLSEPVGRLRPDRALDLEELPPDDPLSGRASGMVEERWRTLDGEPLTVEVSRLASLHEGRAATQVIARDLTERKKLSAKVVAVDRMIAVGTLAAGIGHEINNPLSYVLGNLDQVKSELEARGDTDDQVLELLREAEEGAVRIRDVVRDLRTFTRAYEERRGPVSLEATLESAIRMAQNEIRHRAKLVRDYEPVPVVEGNDGRLRQLVLNLLINSAHAIGEGRAKDNEIRARLYAEARWVVIEIADTGSGMAPNVAQRIFEPFFTTKPVGHGTGLGLTISRQIVEAHGGRIEVESEPQRGTRVFVWLPKLTPTAAATEVVGESPAAPVRRPNLLIIDDEPIICRTVSRLLSGENDVTGVTSGLEALDLLRSSGRPFDLILCDIMMPDLTGMDLFAKVSGERPEVGRRIMFVTGGAFTPRARRFIEEMHDRVLEKPLDGDRLRSFVRRQLARF